MQPIHPEQDSVLYERKASPFYCIKCGSRAMYPIIEEGEPDFTEHYSCQECGYHDTIPSLAIIFSQFATALIGIGISAYLLVNSFRPLADIQSLVAGAGELGLFGISSLFSGGFVYVMYHSIKGYLQRRAYLQPRKNPA